MSSNRSNVVGANALSIVAGNSRIWSDRPLVSVIVPVFNNWELTRACLRSVLASDPSVSLQIVVVDDCSTDATSSELASYEHVDVVRNGVNRGFVGSCNRGAEIAVGTYLLFLNNDAVVDTAAIAALIHRAQADPEIGIVGSKLLFPDGRLQEAGGIIWSDARGWNYGRYDSPKKYQYNFVRDVDYVCGASLLIEKELFDQIGGFDVRFSPAYYEDTDLCFTVRAMGRRVVYEPASIVVHHEGATSGTDLSAGAKRYQVVNQEKFFEKWKAVLEADHFAPDAANVEAAARARRAYTSALLVVEETIPFFDRESGANRLRSLMIGLASSGTRVMFFPDNLRSIEPYTRDLQSYGIEVVYHEKGGPQVWNELFNSAVAAVDAVWICRPVLFRHYLPAIRAISDVPVIYDTIDLHYLRLRGQAEIEGRLDDTGWKEVRELEIACALAADATVVVSSIERGVLLRAGISPVYVIGNIHDPQIVELRNYFLTAGILFIGGFRHQPNVDAADWLVREIMPRVWEKVPSAVLTLLGADPPAAIAALENERVRVPGHVPDVRAHFLDARVFVAPLRYGAGVKGKIGQALSFGLPVVTTSVGAEGFNFKNGFDARIANAADAFAAEVIEVYNDVDVWSDLSYRSVRALRPFTTRSVVHDAQRLISDVTARRSQHGEPAPIQSTCRLEAGLEG